ncbi:hypothetical protein [Roseibium sp. SCP14]|uniref:hypothetical protein n=1 Tax=Roseibium sp. SCP14 TaxID=3141375 RepID=UPI00333C8ABF
MVMVFPPRGEAELETVKKVASWSCDQVTAKRFAARSGEHCRIALHDVFALRSMVAQAAA